METVQLTLDAIFHERVGRAQKQYEYIQDLYDLPRLQYLQHTSGQSLQYLSKKNGFVILVLYSHDSKVYTMYDSGNRELPGASMSSTDDTYDGIQKALRRVWDGIEIRDVQPILFMDNTFCHKDQAHTMNGIVYAARVPNPEQCEISGRWEFFSLTNDFIEGVQKYGNKDILSYIAQHILHKLPIHHIDRQDDEIETNAAMRTRYIVHRILCKPLLSLLWLNKNHRIKQRIDQQCKWADRVIDVSCGDDSTIMRLARDPHRLVVANDISWSQLELSHKHQDNILFTNHNASSLPFKQQTFDIAICKNTLHHMPHRAKLLETLQTLKRIAKSIIIVEIENPQHTGGFAYWLHQIWYRWFLKDVWGAYLGKKQFHDLIEHAFGATHCIESTSFHTWQGTYLATIISPEQHNSQ